MIWLLLALASPWDVVEERDLEANWVVLQGLDKVTGHVFSIEAPIGEMLTFHDLTVTVKRCLFSPPEARPESKAYLVINQKDQRIFSGWMFASRPALSALDHPVYDIWIKKCGTKAQEPY